MSALAYKLPADAKQLRELMFSVPSALNIMSGEMAAPASKLSQTAPRRLVIADTAATTGVFVLNNPEMLSSERIAGLDRPSSQLVRLVEIQPGEGSPSAWPERRGYVINKICEYREKGYQGRLAFFSLNVRSEIPPRVLFVLEEVHVKGWPGLAPPLVVLSGDRDLLSPVRQTCERLGLHRERRVNALARPLKSHLP